MKNLIITLALILGVGFSVSAQTPQSSNEFFLGYTFTNKQVDVKAVQNGQVEGLHGVNAAYTKYFAGKGVKTVGATADFGATFAENDASLVTLMVGLTAKARNNEYFQPYARAMVGAARENVSVRNFAHRIDASPAFLVGAGMDFNLAKASRYKVRLSADYLNTGFGSERNNGVRLGTGLVF